MCETTSVTRHSSSRFSSVSREYQILYPIFSYLPLGEHATQHLIFWQKLTLANDCAFEPDEEGNLVNQMGAYITFDTFFQWLRSSGIAYDKLFTDDFGLYEMFPKGGQKIWVNDRMVQLENDFQENIRNNEKRTILEEHERGKRRKRYGDESIAGMRQKTVMPN